VGPRGGNRPGGRGPMVDRRAGAARRPLPQPGNEAALAVPGLP
jgi:hypothetical protein